jgi:predicted kinase
VDAGRQDRLGAPAQLSAAGQVAGPEPIRPTSSLFVLVAGPPAVGKSTLAAPLAAELGLAVIARDSIKVALMEALGRPGTVEESRTLGRAAVLAMLAIARSSPGAILDSTFYDYTIPLLRALPGALVEIRCIAPREVVEARYVARSATRDPGFFDAHRPFAELWDAHVSPLGVGPQIEVDTSRDVDVTEVAAQVRALAAADPAQRPSTSSRNATARG